MSEARIAKVENRVDALEKRIEKLEKWVGTVDMLAQQCKNRLDKLERITESLGRDLLRIDRAVGEHQSKPHPLLPGQ